MIGIRVEHDSRGLWSRIENLEELPSRRADAIQRIIQSGVLANYDALAWGGSVATADGGSIMWSRVRNRMTIAIRQSRGLGALFPILTLTGKLRRGLAQGSTGGSRNEFTWQVQSDIRALVRVHQFGQAPLPSRSSAAMRMHGRMATVPKRPIIFWSREMVRQVETLAQAAVKGGL